MSGTVFAHWAFSPNPIVNTKKLAIAHGCPFEDSAEIVDCLRQKDAAEIVEKTDRLYVSMLIFKKYFRFSTFV